MSLALVAAILAIGAGAVIAVSTREAAAAVIGLAICLVAASLAADPLPSAAILGVRVVAALLAAALIRWAAAERPHQPSPLGWPGEALLAAAGAVAGLGIATALASVSTSLGGPGGPAGSGGGTDGPAIGAATGMSMGLLLAAGTMLLTLGTAAVLHPRPGLRRAIGLVLVTQAVLLLRVGLAGPAPALEEITRAALLVAAAASASALARAIATTEGPEALE
ncbi:MAG TPA: hypothetical protein VJ850_02080 [Candidatus Limnocylindrales bacterium]|nr:hypothetical protein [Candidatus Limnocylindrales bacterium]